MWAYIYMFCENYPSIPAPTVLLVCDVSTDPPYSYTCVHGWIPFLIGSLSNHTAGVSGSCKVLLELRYICAPVYLACRTQYLGAEYSRSCPSKCISST
jgi:hypothetical protein